MARLDTACNSGSLVACDTLGMYYYAQRSKGPRATAAQIWDKACTAEGVGACANLALAYDDGEGVARDRPRAFGLARNACDKGSMPACVAVASMLSDGRGGTLDLRAGNAMMKRACDGGDFYACMNRGYRLLDGSFGETKDPVKAQQAFERACTVGVRDHPYPWYRRAIGESCQLAANPKG